MLRASRLWNTRATCPHESWHSVARTSDADGERNSLMLTYCVQDGLLGWLAQRLQRLAVFIGYGLRE